MLQNKRVDKFRLCLQTAGCLFPFSHVTFPINNYSGDLNLRDACFTTFLVVESYWCTSWRIRFKADAPATLLSYFSTPTPT